MSIVVPTYNHGPALPALLDSIRAQTVQDFEVVVVDDGSTDGTANVVRRYVRRHDEGMRIRYLRGEHRGAPAARNRGAASTGGAYLLFADADLILQPDMLARLLQALRERTEASYAYSSFRFGWKKFRSHPFNAVALRQGNYIHTAALIRRDHFLGFDERLVRFQDWDLWLTMLERGYGGVFVPTELFRARVTRAGISRWRPRLWYAFWGPVWRWTSLAPASYRRYVQLRRVVLEKHGLP